MMPRQVDESLMYNDALEVSLWVIKRYCNFCPYLLWLTYHDINVSNFFLFFFSWWMGISKRCIRNNDFRLVLNDNNIFLKLYSLYVNALTKRIKYFHTENLIIKGCLSDVVNWCITTWIVPIISNWSILSISQR